MRPAGQDQGRLGRGLSTLCRAWAYAGGALLLGLAGVTLVSVTGRALSGIGLGPVPGDFELVEMGTAVAVFAFLPWCQLRQGHVTVDILSRHLPPRLDAFLGLLGNLALSVCAAVILWRFWLGFAEKFPLGGPVTRGLLGLGPKPYFTETTYELQIPVWIPYGFALIGAALFCLACVYSVWRSLGYVRLGAEPMTETGG